MLAEVCRHVRIRISSLTGAVSSDRTWALLRSPRVMGTTLRGLRMADSSTTVLQTEQIWIELFCGQRLRARPTRETLCGIHGWPGASRGARRSGNAVEDVLRGIAAAGRTQKRGADGGPSGAGQRAADTSVAAPRSG